MVSWSLVAPSTWIVFILASHASSARFLTLSKVSLSAISSARFFLAWSTERNEVAIRRVRVLLSPRSVFMYPVTLAPPPFGSIPLAVTGLSSTP